MEATNTITSVVYSDDIDTLTELLIARDIDVVDVVGIPNSDGITVYHITHNGTAEDIEQCQIRQAEYQAEIDRSTGNDPLAREIRAQRNGLVNALRTREVHPSYGVTKADLRERLARLEGLLHAYSIVVYGRASAALRLAAIATADRHFEIDLRDLIRQVEEA